MKKSLLDYFRWSKKGHSQESIRESRQTLALERLEDRELLSVTSAEYESIRSLYSDLDLSANYSSMNFIELTAPTMESLQKAIDVAGKTAKDELVILRTDTPSSTTSVTLEQSLTISIDSSLYGSLTFISLGETPFRFNMATKDSGINLTLGNLQFGGIEFYQATEDASLFRINEAISLEESSTTWVNQSCAFYNYAGENITQQLDGQYQIDTALETLRNDIATNDTASVSTNDFAVIFIGSANTANNGTRYGVNLLELYDVLATKVDIAPENIYVLFANGASTVYSINEYLPGWSSNAIVSIDTTAITNNGSHLYSATQSNLYQVFSELNGRMNSDSHLLFYSYDHGSGVPNAPTNYNDYLVGWSDSSHIAGSTVSDALFQVQQGYVSCVFTQCYAGGILDDIFDLSTGDVSSNYKGNATFAGVAATNHYEPSWTSCYITEEEKKFIAYAGFAQSFTFYLASGEYTTVTDLFQKSIDDDPFTVKSETYEKNAGTYTNEREHPWQILQSGKSDFYLFNSPTLSLTDDKYEENDTQETATDLGHVQGVFAVPSLVAGTASNEDWYKFTVDYTWTNDQAIGVQPYPMTNSSLSVTLYNEDQQTVASTTGGNWISVSALAAGTYYLKVYNTDSSAAAVSYSITLKTPCAETFETATDDSYEPNDTIDTATNLGTPDGFFSLTGLYAGTGQNKDFYKFELATDAWDDSYAEVTFVTGSATYQSQKVSKALAFTLLDGNGVAIGSKTSSSGVATFSLKDQSAGIYYLRVYSSYDLSISIPYTITINAPKKETPSTVVTTKDDIVDAYDGVISLREAISYAKSNETITFDGSLNGETILLETSLGSLTLDQSLTIDASALSQGLTLSGQTSCRIMTVEESCEVELCNLTLSDGNNGEGQGGGIYNLGALTLTGCTLSGNTAAYGGGVYLETGASLALNGTVFSGNSASVNGGAIANQGGTVTSSGTSNTFMGNYANSNGGAIYHNGSLNISNTDFQLNYTVSGNGGAYCGMEGTATFSGSTFTSNSSKGDPSKTLDWTKSTGGSGGALMNWSAGQVQDQVAIPGLKVTNCTFDGNSAVNGGAIANGYSNSVAGTIVVDGTTAIGTTTGNQAFYGGAIFNAGALTMTGTSTASISIRNNQSIYNGGAISNSLNGTHTLNPSQQYLHLTYVALSSNSAGVSLGERDAEVGHGGAIINQTAVTLLDSSFTGNKALTESVIEGSYGSGGAIVTLRGANLSTERTTFSQNQAAGSGGALQIWGTNVALGAGTTLSENSAIQGGAISVTYSGAVTLSGTETQKVVIDTNQAEYGGGILAANTVIFENYVSVTSNKATVNGGGISLAVGTLYEGQYRFGSLTVTGTGSTVTGNTAEGENQDQPNGYGGGILSVRGTRIDVALSSGLTVSGNYGTASAKDSALSNVALLRYASSSLGESPYLYRTAECGYTYSNQTFSLLNFNYTTTSTDTTKIAKYSINEGERVTDWRLLTNIPITGDALYLQIFDEKGEVITTYNLPMETRELPAKNALQEAALIDYLDEVMEF